LDAIAERNYPSALAFLAVENKDGDWLEGTNDKPQSIEDIHDRAWARFNNPPRQRVSE
jgi:hypothetical protein